MSVSPVVKARANQQGSCDVFPPSYLTPSPTIGSPSSASTPKFAAASTPIKVEQNKNNQTSSNVVQKPSNGRRGVKKSRAGCFTCKRQKLKCKENRPVCDYCAHRNIKCEWPTLFTSMNSSATRSKAPVTKNYKAQPTWGSQAKADLVLERLPTSILSHDTPPVSTPSDIRLFKYFVKEAYPNHPSGNESVWTHEIPSLSSKYDYLINSMLALAASELSLADLHTSPSNSLTLHCTSLHYRSKAVTSLSRAIQRGIPTSAEGNAMLATILSLIFQSTFIADGLVEYMTFIRGSIVVSKQMGMQGLAIIFKTDESRMPEPKGMGEIDRAPKLQPDVIRGAIESLDLCEVLCKTDLERRVWTTVWEAAGLLEHSSSQGYLQLRKMYALFAHQMTSADFHDFTSPDSPSAQVFRILQAHFVALQLIMNPIAAVQARSVSPCPVKDEGRTATVGWLTNLHNDLKDMTNGKLENPQKYYVWTRWVEREILAGRLLDGSRPSSACVTKEKKVGGSTIAPGTVRCPR